MRKLTFILCLLQLVLLAYSRQVVKLDFEHIETKGYTVYNMCKDKDGVLWLATNNGLTTYANLTGRHPAAYAAHPELCDVAVRVTCDQRGRLWFSGFSQNISIYDPHTGKVETNIIPYMRSLGIDVWYVGFIDFDRKGRWWIRSDQGLIVYDEAKRQQFRIPLGAEEKVLQLRILDDETILMTSRRLLRISLESLKPETIVMLPYRPSDEVAAVNKDASGNVWVCNGRNLSRWDGQWHDYEPLPSDVKDILCTADNGTIVGTNSNGLLIYDAEGRLAEQIKYRQQPGGGLLNNHVEAMFYDRESGNTWISYHKQNMSVAESNTEKPYIIMPTVGNEATNDVLSFAYDPQGKRFWIGTEDEGLQGDTQIQTPAAVVSLLYDRRGRLWMGVFRGGLFCIENGHIRHYLPERSPYQMVEDGDGNIFVALLNNGVVRVSADGNDVRQMPVKCIYVQNIAYYKGNVYVASADGLYSIDTKRLTCRWLTGGPHAHLYCFALYIDSRGWAWILANRNTGSVILYDIAQKKQMVVEQFRGNSVKSVVEDDFGHLWFATEQGLMRLTVKDEGRKQFEVFTYHRLRSRYTSYNERAAINLHDGRLAFGTTAGVQYVNVLQKTETAANQQGAMSDAFRLLLASVTVNGSAIMPGDSLGGRVLLHQDIPFLESLDLAYDENNLVVEVQPRDYVSSLYVSYFYRLEGLSDSWLPLYGNTITMSNLPTGHFRLRIRQTDIDSGKSLEYDLLTIRVTPPFWRSTLARTLYAVAALLLLAAVYMYLHRRRRFRERMRQMEMEAERTAQLNEMKTAFFTNISHDLRTPLSLIVSPVQELQKRINDGEHKYLLNLIQKNADHLLALVGQILDFRKLENGKVELKMAYNDIMGFIAERCQVFDALARERNMKFCFTTDTEHLTMKFDSDKLGKILMNLLGNAFKFTPRGGEITVSAQVDGEHLTVSVADTGCGISDSDKARVFERFYQTEHQDKTYIGTGIGLHIVKEYTELMRGTVTVGDNRPQGTVFRISLPIQRQREDTVVTDKAMTILLVEDNRDLLDYIGGVMAQDYNVRKAENGVQALEVLRSEDVDIVVSDIMMEQMDGWELCYSIKTDIEISHIPVILLTAKSLEEDELKGLEMGADDYMTKPFNMDILRQRVYTLAERHRQRQENFRQNADITPPDIAITTLDEQLLQKAITQVEQNIDRADYSVELLSDALGMHRASLYKKITYLTGKTPLLFIRLIRLKRARQMFDQGERHIAQVAYAVGFNSAKVFAMRFKEEFGETPTDYIANINKNI